VAFKPPESLVLSWKRGPAMHASPDPDVLAWIPPGRKRIRAVMLIPNNTDLKNIGEHAALRAVAEAQAMAIVFLQHCGGEVLEFTNDPRETAVHYFLALLQHLSEETGIADILNAPWVTIGKSSRGRFPFRCAWLWPERVVASMQYHGEVPLV
jgi:hypothetical protein